MRLDAQYPLAEALQGPRDDPLDAPDQLLAAKDLIVAMDQDLHQ
jgi:hypothetical protein